MRELGRGVGAFTPGERVKHPEVYELQKRIGRPFTWTALLTRKGMPFASDMTALNARERADGADVWPQVTCRPLTFQMTMADPFTFNTVPAFRDLMDRPVEERLAAYADPEWRRVAQEQLENGRIFRARWDIVTVAESPAPSGARGPLDRRPGRGAGHGTARDGPAARRVEENLADPVPHRARERRRGR